MLSDMSSSIIRWVDAGAAGNAPLSDGAQSRNGIRKAKGSAIKDRRNAGGQIYFYVLNDSELGPFKI